MWRLAHLIGALSIMLLVLTGMTVLYADSFWAPTVVTLLGGPKSAAILHRTGAVGFMTVFFAHLIYFAYDIGRNWRTFKWFGPDSLVPNWQDFKDSMAFITLFSDWVPALLLYILFISLKKRSRMLLVRCG